MFLEILSLFLFVRSEAFAQALQVVTLETKLPVPIYGMPALYDGEDSIYVLGGSGANDVLQRDILKFDVRTEKLTKIGTMDPVAFGSAGWGGDDSILYYGGENNYGSAYESNVWNYKPDGSSNWVRVGLLPGKARYTSSVRANGEFSYVFGGKENSNSILSTISRYSSVTNNAHVVGQLPRPSHGTSAIWNGKTGDAYIFGGLDNVGIISRDIVKFNPTDGSVLTINVTLPVPTHSSCAIWTGGPEAYIIGGLGNSGESLKVARFNPSTYEVLNIPVNNFPSQINSHGCAFVSKQNRIYIFGGWTVGSGVRDAILCIDLSPTNPTTTPSTTTTTPTQTTTKRPGTPIDCTNEVDGTRLPDPFCCKSFYQCENGDAIPRQCPSQLHFNPSHAECDLPEIVKCRSVYE